jgi:hypothetical protein
LRVWGEVVGSEICFLMQIFPFSMSTSKYYKALPRFFGLAYREGKYSILLCLDSL